MLKKNHFFIILLFISFCCSSQTLKVVNQLTNIPIPYANYSVYKDKKIVQGSYCSENGKIVIKKGVDFDYLVVTCLGYEDLTISKEKIVNDTLLLKPTVYHLKEVVIKTNKNIQFQSLGFIKSKSKSHLGAFKGMEICTYIENPYRQVKTIHSVLFKIINPNKSKLGLRIHLYEFDSILKSPGKELLNQDVIVIIDKKGKNDIDYDVSAYNLEFPSNGAFIGIEWLGELNSTNDFEDTVVENGFIEINDNSNTLTTFMKNRFAVFPWSNMEHFKRDTNCYKNSPNASFGITVELE